MIIPGLRRSSLAVKTLFTTLFVIASFHVPANGGTLFGLTSFNGGPAQFGSIDPVTGAFTQIGNASLPSGYYAPVYDPTQDAFYVITQPIGDNVFTAAIDRIDPLTGAVTQFHLPIIPVGGGDPPLLTVALGLAAGAATPASVPEPSSALLLVVFPLFLATAMGSRRTMAASRTWQCRRSGREL
jgi:hypothetical protein